MANTRTLNILKNFKIRTSKRNYSNNLNNSPNINEDKGNIKLDGKLIMITRRDLEILIEEFKQKVKQSYSNNKWDSEDLIFFQKLANGFFQAEGSWSGQFFSDSSSQFNPKFSIGQNISGECLEFFALLWVVWIVN